MRHEKITFVAALTMVMFGLAEPALATFACTVANTPGGKASLHERPDEASQAIREVTEGDLVSDLGSEGVAVPEGWMHVAHEVEQSGNWGLGDKGFMLSRYLDECG